MTEFVKEEKENVEYYDYFRRRGRRQHRNTI
jgi:hypothetical protein